MLPKLETQWRWAPLSIPHSSQAAQKQEERKAQWKHVENLPSLQCPLLAKLNVMPAGKGEIVTSSSSSNISRAMKGDLEMRGNKLLTAKGVETFYTPPAVCIMYDDAFFLEVLPTRDNLLDCCEYYW